MDFETLKNKAKDFLPAILIQKLVDNFVFKLFNSLFYVLTGVFAFFSLILAIFKKIAEIYPDKNFSAWFNVNLIDRTEIIFGIFFIVLAIALVFLMLKSFFNSYAFLDIVPQIYDEDFKHPEKMSFESARFLLNKSRANALLALTSGDLGKIVLTRLGLSYSEIYNFLDNEVKKISLGDLNYSSLKDFINIEDLAELIFNQDKEFQTFLASRLITKEEFLGAVKWAGENLLSVRRRARFWSRDRLRQVPGLGKDWSYGEAPTLWSYANSASSMAMFSEANSVEKNRSEEVDLLERTLSRAKGANALLVSDTDSEGLSVVMALAKRILDGKVAPEIENQEVYVLDHNSLIAKTKDKALFEQTLIQALTEAISAGNIILIIRDLPGMMASAKALGSNVSSLLDWYLKSANIHIVVTSNNSAYHSVLERDQTIMTSFEKILIKTTQSSSALNYLKNEALLIENKEGVFFTFPAVKSALDNAERFFSEGTLEDKGSDLLSETAVFVKRLDRVIVEKSDILKIVEEKTGVPISSTSAVGESQNKNILLNLEQILGDRVIGQKAGILAISSALRRAQSGVGNPKRPMGSFLFLGPTGVGKTETTKALADAFFGGESAIIRLDMSEFQTDDALERLIGDFARGQAGVLSSKLRDRPYGVLLLDEFEKTSKKVLDLFLQILDEGFFSDMSGKRVNARNLIIIATSNAGSSLIWNMVKESGEEGLDKDKIVSEIINQGIFKPELVNRFDGVIVFHPLTTSNLREIAKLMLQKLNHRLLDKGIEVKITDDLISALITKGVDPTFGARPMARAIQDKVESIIADRLLRGEVNAGDKIVFTEEDLEKIKG